MRGDAWHSGWRLGLGSLFIAVGASPIAFLLILLMGIKSPWFWPAVMLVVVSIIVVIQLFVRVIPNAAGSALLRFLMPQDSGPQGMVYSHAQAMAVRGDTDGASQEFQRLLKAAPEDVALHRAAAEYFSRVDASLAASIYQRLRQIPRASTEDEHYATHRLIDMYGGVLQNKGRMRVELRRLVERFPGTRDAAGAEVALKRLREDEGTGD